MSRYLIVAVIVAAIGGGAHVVNRRSRRRTAEVVAAARMTTVVVSVSPRVASQLQVDHPELTALVDHLRPVDVEAAATVAPAPVAAADSPVTP